MRRYYAEVLSKMNSGVAMEPLELLIAEVIESHPEYHLLLADGRSLLRDVFPEAGDTNPYLHLSMHVAIAEQVKADRPPGIRAAYASARERHADFHALEHQMMQCLEAVMWQAQGSGTAPDEHAYLACVHGLAQRR